MIKRIAVLASGGGSNLQALLDHFASLEDTAPGEVTLVASDRASSGALQKARARGIPAIAMDREMRTFGLAALLTAHDIDLVVLAGYLRFVPAEVTRAYRGRFVNVHPSLLPAFGGPGMYGVHVHDAVIARGARVSGVTVHFVDEEYDHGPIIAQWPVPVFASDTTESLALRVLRVEHAVYPLVIQRICEGAISLGDGLHVRGAFAVPIFSHFMLAVPGDSPAAGFRAVLG